MEIYFGLSFDEASLPKLEGQQGGIQFLGPKGIIHFLESRLGLTGLPRNNNYIRIEQYRQAILYYLDNYPAPFFEASFNADQFATATALLERRDELLLSGWNFEQTGSSRLDGLSRLEEIIRQGEFTLDAGYADRFIMVMQKIGKRKIELSRITVHEPTTLLPYHFQSLFNRLSAHGITIDSCPAPETTGNTDLAVFKKTLLGNEASRPAQKLRADGSLLIIKGKQESALASFLAQLARYTPSFQTSLLVQDKNHLLDHALTMEGLPSLGMPSASLARPTLQVLKLITVFLWQPIDLFKVMEFVSLAVKPLDRELSNRIASQLAKTPGLNNDGWIAMRARFFAELKEKAQHNPKLRYSEIEQQFNKLFNRKRYDIAGTAPKNQIISLFKDLSTWARDCFEEEGSKNTSLLVLAEQAKQIKELLEELPETRLSQLRLEQIVRAISEPAPIQLRECKIGHFPYSSHPGAIHKAIDTLGWWNFTQAEPQHFFSRWYKQERQLLLKQGVQLDSPEQENARLIWHRKRPILHTQKQLLLFIPEHTNGKAVPPHPLFGDLQATFTNLKPITLNIDSPASVPDIFKAYFNIPKRTPLAHQKLGKPQPMLHLNINGGIAEREKESFSSLNDLFYYPYQWIFKYKAQFKNSSILSVAQDNRLMGNLAHSMFERLLQQQGVNTWDKHKVEQFIEEQQTDLFNKEGAVLLMYGKEPERVNFIQRLKFAAWSLIQHIKENGWTIAGTEIPIEGTFESVPLKGRADLVLKRGDEMAVVDLKWRGSNYRAQMIRNEEDLQLMLYSKLVGDANNWAHTSFFIMEKGLMIGRNNLAFSAVNGIDQEASIAAVNERIFDRMKKTYQWRLSQIKNGYVEIRCAETEAALEAYYEEENLFDLLEMKSGDAPFDPYQALINKID